MKRLSGWKHEVVISHQDKDCAEIKQRIEDGYIHDKSTSTRGDTELGINENLESTNLKDVNFEKVKAMLSFADATNINYNKVRCIANIYLAKREKSLKNTLIKQGGDL